MTVHQQQIYRYVDHDNSDAATKNVNGGANLKIGPVPKRGIVNFALLYKSSGAQAVDVRIFSRDPAAATDTPTNGGRYDLTRDYSGGKLTIPSAATGEIEGSIVRPYDLGRGDDEHVASVLNYTASGQPTAGDTITICGQTFTFVAAAASPARDHDVVIGSDYDETYGNLVTAFNAFGLEVVASYSTPTLSFTSPTAWSYATHRQFVAVALDISDITAGLAEATHTTGTGEAHFLYLKCDDPSGANLVGGELSIEDRTE